MKKIFIVFLSAFALLGCNQDLLDIPQKGVVATEDFYQTDDDAKMALVAAYDAVTTKYMAHYWNDNIIYALWNYFGDDIYAAGENKSDGLNQNELHSFRYPTNNQFINTGYNSFYQSIYAANLVIDNFKDGTSEVMKNAVAEAKVLRALSYLQLAIGWGTPPIVDHVLAAADKPTNAESQDAVLDFIVKDIDEALPYLGDRQGPNDKNGIYRVTKGLAYTLKGKALLWKKDYTGAQAALKNVITSNNYQLVDDLAGLFHVRGDGSPEKIFELNIVYDSSIGGAFTMHSQANMSWYWNWRASRVWIPTGEGSIMYNNGWGGVNASQKFVDALLENDGMDSKRRKAWVLSYDEVLYEMPYSSDYERYAADEGDHKAGDYKLDADGKKIPVSDQFKKEDKSRGVYHNEGIYGHCGWFMMKVNINAEDIRDGNFNERNTRIFRYPEVILMFAECATQTGQDKDLAFQLVKQIQERAESKTVWTSVADLTLENVKKEKMIEMWLEGCRYQDLIRWGDTDELKDNGKSYPNWKDEINDGKKEHKGYLDTSDADWCVKQYPGLGFQTGKHELFPFPFSETSVNENIKQNPGW